MDENKKTAIDTTSENETQFVECEIITTDKEKGLTAAEVQERVTSGKVNGDQNVKTKSVAQILRENIVTFFNFVFIVLAVLICFFIDSGENILAILGNFGFLILIIFNALVGIFQELRAKRTIDKLSLISAPKTIVIRDGEQTEIAVKDIVLDDIAVLASGSQICADSFIVEGSVEVNESLITGEPDAILKNVGDKVMSGSFVVSGNAKAQVEHVGMDNFATKISAGAKYFKKPNSEIWRSLMFIVKVMASIIVPMGVILFCVKYFVQQNPEQSEKIITKDGIELRVKAKITVRSNIARLVSGAGEETILARVGEGIVTTVGSAETHTEVLENPDIISKTVLNKGLDVATAYEILSIEMADIDVGQNIGAKLNIDRAEADKSIAQAKAEERRAMAYAMEQEMRAKTQEMKAMVLAAEAEVPKAMANAIKNGQMGVMDYYKLQNLNSDTAMRNSIAGIDNKKKNG